MADAPLPLASPSDLGTWLGQTIAADDARAVAVLRRASARVRSYCGRTWLNDNLTLGDVPEDVAGVVVQVASRVWVNPQGLIRSGGGDVSERAWGATGETGVYLTDGEKDTLAPFKNASRSGLWTLRTTRDDCLDGTTYVPTGPPPSGPDFPWYADDVDTYGLHP